MPKYKGEHTCCATVKSTGKPCIRKAYYIASGKVYCGTHSRSLGADDLPVNPNASKIAALAYEKHNSTVKKVARSNRKNGKIGSVTVSKLRMMKKPEQIDGYLAVFPNFKHQNRKDGFGCKSLSPKAIGPIEHHMPNLPASQNLENYHQGAKHWDFEFKENGSLKSKYFQKRIDMYNDTIPYRHKWDNVTLLKYSHNSGNKNIPKCSIYYDTSGEAHYYTYLECRYFYCHYYEKLVANNEDFLHLKKLLKRGYNLNIIGYDGYSPLGTSSKKLYNMYLDTTKPFGHEMVLYTLLVCDNPKKYPWNMYYKANKSIYKNVI